MHILVVGSALMDDYIYTEEIAATYGVKRATVQKWAREGKLPETYRRTGLTGTGAPYEWTREQLKGWKPPKKGQRVSVELPERTSTLGLWSVATAASESGYPAGNLYRWIRSGHLRGFLSGGKVYVWPDDLRAFEPPKRGRPKKSQDISEVVPSEDAWAVPGSEDAPVSEGGGHSESDLSEGDVADSWPYPGL